MVSCAVSGHFEQHTEVSGMLVILSLYNSIRTGQLGKLKAQWLDNYGEDSWTQGVERSHGNKSNYNGMWYRYNLKRTRD